MIGSSPAFLEMLESISRYARHERPVLVMGERGTGKEEVASRLHYLSPRWQQNLVKLNCAAFNDELLDSELFGHVAGSFTGARQARTGLFQAADGGTLFLDELATMGPRLQEKLLRVVEYGELYRVGSSRPVQVDVRVVAATNENLPQLAREGRFREDLLDRLAFDVVAIPPLRARQEDVLLLANHFAVRISHELGEIEDDIGFAGFSGSAIETLNNYQWPGNVRELKNVVERSVCHSIPGEPIEDIVLDPFSSPWLSGLKSSNEPDVKTSKEEYRSSSSDIDVTNKTGQLELWLEQMRDGQVVELKGVLAETERSFVHHAMENCRHNQKAAAEMLGLSYDQFRSLIKKYGKARVREQEIIV
ncbi:phage shock protein operon transcriptional activator [Endozoicomonas sp. ALC013]|uniref:phage shock protein operon transcriptional activator n=1 Tax=Endozoicomonas sp. ALC013 TaxID=3403076 RepID=UPI003BB80425